MLLKALGVLVIHAIGDTCSSEMNVSNSSNKLMISSATDTHASKYFAFAEAF